MKARISSCLLALSFFLFSHHAEANTKVNDSESNNKYQAYLELLSKYPSVLGPNGNYLNKEIEIVTDPALFPKIEKDMNRMVGIVAQDKYWLWINDAVRFPNGRYGVYGRFLWQASLNGYAGVAVFILSKEGRVALNCNYRHATRSWELELPRGMRNVNENIYEAAQREVKEETGMILEELVLLGTMAIDTGFTNSVAPIFMAKMAEQADSSPEDSESIVAVPFFTLDEIRKGLVQGYLTTTIEGKEQKVFLRDPFLSFALLQAQLQHLLPE